jgi:hypothetical protein
MPVQLAIQTFEKSSLPQKEDPLQLTALARYPSKRRTARTHSVSAKRSRKTKRLRGVNPSAR